MASDTHLPSCAFGIVAYDPETAGFGIALGASTLAIGARCPFIAREKAAISSQGFTNLKTGPLAIDLIQHGLAPDEVLESLKRHDRWMEYRQIAIIATPGEIAVHTGAKVRSWAGHQVGDNFVCLGNGLRDEAVLETMSAAFSARADGAMARRLLDALEAASKRLAPEQVLHSASVRVMSPSFLEEIDLRIDRATRRSSGRENGVKDLIDLYEAYLPHAEVYNQRSRNPKQSLNPAAGSHSRSKPSKA